MAGICPGSASRGKKTALVLAAAIASLLAAPGAGAAPLRGGGGSVWGRLVGGRVPELNLKKLGARPLSPSTFCLEPVVRHYLGVKLKGRLDHRGIEAIGPEASDFWQRMKLGLLEHAAMMEGFFPGRRIVYLGRDGVYQYYASRILSGRRGRDRHVLLDISRPLLDLAEKDGSQKSLLSSYLAPAKGAAALFDTGFSGSVIRRIKSLFPGEYDHLKGSLHCSFSEEFPSSPPFLAAVDRGRGGKVEVLAEASMPKGRYRANRLARDQRGVFALSTEARSDEDDGVIGTKLFPRFISDLKYTLTSPRHMALFRSRALLWRELRDLSLAPGKRSLLDQRLAELSSSPDPSLRKIGEAFPELARMLTSPR
jgi:hypothetical protein